MVARSVPTITTPGGAEKKAYFFKETEFVVIADCYWLREPAGFFRRLEVLASKNERPFGIVRGLCAYVLNVSTPLVTKNIKA